MNKTLQNEKSMPQVFYAKHMKAGVANYPENKEVIYISNDTIADMAKSIEGKPVYVHHGLPPQWRCSQARESL